MKKFKNVISSILLAVMLTAVLGTGASASSSTAFEPVSISEGEPVTITWSDSYTGTVVNVDGDTYIPESFLLWVEGTSTVTVDGTAVAASMTNTGNDGYVITTGSAEETIVVDITESSMSAVGTYTITCPAQNGSIPTSAVSAVEGYLPVGQFATGTGWGSSTGKFTSTAYSSTGVSLGAAGGYIQLDLSSPIYNLAANAYGVDFVVYGNAFNGNPEAGSVKVYGYQEGETTPAWYDLAGSLYYDDISENNATVSYKMISSGDNAGIWYQLNNGEWTKFTTKTAWWPTVAKYQNSWGSVDGVTWDQTNNIITYTGVSLVKDTDTTNDYQFGYFDVHINGSNYGVAQNPYTVTNTAKCGDGFDLSWAVDTNGNPVKLTHITKVRLYTAAALNSTGTAFTTPAIFGETSAEFCGLFKATGTGTGEASTTLTVKQGNKTETLSNMSTINLVEGSCTISSGAEHVFVNGVLVDAANEYTFDVEADQNYQIITQNGTESPIVVVIKGVE